MAFWVYIMASKRNGSLYIGQTDNLARRVYEHKQQNVPSYTQRNNIDKLVWYAEFLSRDEAKTTELRMKAWKRGWKLELIEKDNPNWGDLYLTLNG